MDPIQENREHHLRMLGIISIVTMVIVLGMTVWFFLEWSNFNRRNFNPTKDEKTLNIEYGFEDSSYVFMPLSSIAALVYLIGGAILLSSDIQIDHQALVLSMAIIPAVLGCVMLLNSGVSFQSNKSIKKTYNDSAKQSAAIELKNKQVPYIDTAISSLVIGVTEILAFITLLAYFYYMVPKKSPPAPPVPSQRYVPQNFLQNDARGVNPQRVRFQ